MTERGKREDNRVAKTDGRATGARCDEAAKLERSAELSSDRPGNIKVGEFVLEVTVAKQKLTN